MARTLAEAAASSTAHGLGKAASAQRTSVRVMWILLFFTFLALFFKSGFNLVRKLNDRRLIKEYHADKVQFVFPDLYFCPRNPYSGSYPYTLTKPVADLINDEISRIVRKMDELHSDVVSKLDDSHFRQHRPSLLTKLNIVQESLPFTLIANYLVQRKEQSVLYAVVTPNANLKEKPVYLLPFHLPGHLVCFNVDLNPVDKLSLQFANSTLELWLSTDPFFSEVNFTGYPINPITDEYNNTIPFKNWHPIYNREFMMESGYTMLLVPPGAYPSLEFETKLKIGPGNSYTVEVEMVEASFSEDLHGTHCVANPPETAFENPLTGGRELFKYSSAVCYLQRRLSSAVNKTGCRFSKYPMLWEHKFMPRCFNVSEMTPAIYYTNFVSENPIEAIDSIAEMDASCRNRIPCNYPKYSVSSSVVKWPSVSRSTAEDLASFSSAFTEELGRPGVAKLVAIAQEMLNGSHSAHLEGLFRMYMSESWLKVRISAVSAMSSQVVLTWSYTLTDFLADTGGLLGLYIGCSLLTLCELLELLYILIEYACKRSSQAREKTREAEAAVDDQPKDVASAVDTEQKCEN